MLHACYTFIGCMLHTCYTYNDCMLYTCYTFIDCSTLVKQTNYFIPVAFFGDPATRAIRLKWSRCTVTTSFKNRIRIHMCACSTLVSGKPRLSNCRRHLQLTLESHQNFDLIDRAHSQPAHALSVYLSGNLCTSRNSFCKISILTLKTC